MGSVARYRCDMCGKEFDSITQLDDHYRIDHPTYLTRDQSSPALSRKERSALHYR